MGAWGPGLFDDDLACAIRDEFRDRIAAGAAADAVTLALLTGWRETLADPEDGPVALLALAETQWDCGRLDPRVKRRALALLAAGGDVERWRREAPELANERATVLARLGKKLAKQPPRPKKITPRRRVATELEPGDLLLWRLVDSKRWLPLWVAELAEDKSGRSPVVVPLSRTYAQKPSAARLAKVDACWYHVRGQYGFSGKWLGHWVAGMEAAEHPGGLYRRITTAFTPAGGGNETTSSVSQLYDPGLTDAFLRSLVFSRAIIQCTTCAACGYKPSLGAELEPGVSTAYARDHYEPLKLGRDGRCAACR